MSFDTDNDPRSSSEIESPTRAGAVAPPAAETAVLFGAKLRAARRKAGYRQRDLAARTGVTLQYVSMIEGGHRVVNLTTAAGLASALGLELWTLLKPDGSPNPRQ